MLFKNVTLIDENMLVRENMYLGTEGEKITYIGKDEPKNPEAYGEVFNRKNTLLVPAFYNCHSHSPMFLLRGYAESLSLMSWLNDRIFPFEHCLNENDIYYSSLMSAAEMLRFGIVGTTDMYYHPLTTARAFDESGIKASIGGCTLCFDEDGYEKSPNYAENEELFRLYGNNSGARIKPNIAIHAEYTNTEKSVTEAANHAKKLGASIHVHVSETAGEVGECKKRHAGKSPVKFFRDCGVFDVPTVAAHCVWLSDEDVEILAEKNVTAATNPKSNLKLASGVCPVPKLLKKGVNVALGTDSVASNNNLNMLEEMKLYALIHKGISGDPTAITPAEALYAATKAGAIAQQRPDCGSLKVGNRADIAVFDTSEVYMKPVHNMLNNLVFSACGNDVIMTVADGKVLYRGGEYKTLDIEKIYAETERSRVRILSMLG